MRYAEPGEFEDLIQDIPVELWRSYESFRGGAKVETWVYRVALNTALSGIRKKVSQRTGDQRFNGMFQEATVTSSLAEKTS